MTTNKIKMDNPELLDKMHSGVITNTNILISAIKNISDKDKTFLDLDKLPALNNQNLQDILETVNDKKYLKILSNKWESKIKTEKFRKATKETAEQIKNTQNIIEITKKQIIKNKKSFELH